MEVTSTTIRKAEAKTIEETKKWDCTIPGAGVRMVLLSRIVRVQPTNVLLVSGIT